jgi:hypothetical protein
MYTVKRISESVIELRSETFSFHSTKVSYWYYDIKQWLCSYIGVKDEVPTQKMTQSEIDWCVKWYLPKLKEN